MIATGAPASPLYFGVPDAGMSDELAPIDDVETARGATGEITQAHQRELDTIVQWLPTCAPS